MKEKEAELINNSSLISNSLEHILFELERKETSYFRIARESHLILNRMMVEALRGSNNAFVEGKQFGKKYKIVWGDIEFYEAHDVKIDGCKKAWRYSKPVACEAPRDDTTTNYEPQPNEKLVGFYHLLAMIQCDGFMIRYTMSKTIDVSDQEMNILEWVHESIRNDYEHFIPKLKLAPMSDLSQASLTCLKISHKLLMNSGNIHITNRKLEEYLFISIERIKLLLI